MVAGKLFLSKKNIKGKYLTSIERWFTLP